MSSAIVLVLALSASAQITIDELVQRSRDLQQQDSLGAALRTADEALKQAVGTGVDLAPAELQLARVLSDMGRYDDALEHGLAAMRASDAVNRPTVYYEAWNAVGLTHYRMRHLDDARRAFEGVLLELGPEGDARTRAFALNNMGMLEHSIGHADTALVNYARSLELKFAIGDSAGASRTLNNIGTVHAGLAQPDSALRYYRWSLAMKRQLHDRSGEASTLGNIGELFGSLGALDSAQAYLEHAKQLADGIGNLETQANVLHNLAELYKAQGDPQRALDTKEVFIATNAKLLNERYNKRVADLQVGFDLERKNAEILRLEEEAQVKRTRLILAWSLAAALVAAVVLLVMALKARALTLKHKQEAFDRRQELDALKLQAMEVENERLGIQVDHKSRELSTMATHALQKNQLLSGLLEKMDAEEKRSGDPALLLRMLRKSIRENIDLDADWEQFKLHFVEVHPKFFGMLQQQSADLSQTDLRHCAYIRMDLGTKEIARLLSIEPSSVQIARVRLKKKLALDKDTDLKDFIRSLGV
jgi:tetratricopeptide (TPR) repeat protein